jgi:hypothetical protein
MSKKDKEKLPIGKNEDVEFSKELADREDLQALKRANRADRSQDKKE